LFFASGLSEAIEDEGTRNGGENEHVEEYVEDEHAIVPGILFDSGQLVVWVGVIGSQDVGNKDHFVKLEIIVLIFIEGLGFGD